MCISRGFIPTLLLQRLTAPHTPTCNQQQPYWLLFSLLGYFTTPPLVPSLTAVDAVYHLTLVTLESAVVAGCDLTTSRVQ
jgi:hypothetical protein